MPTYNNKNLKKGMVVYIGRDRGEQTKAVVEKANPKSVKVKILEQRGNGRGSDVGHIWNVAYDYIKPYDGADVGTTVIPMVKQEPLKYNMFDDRNSYFELMLDCYSGLSPENLHQDGEASRSHVIAQSAKLNRRLKYLKLAIDAEVSESDLYAWHRSKQDYLESDRNRRLKETSQPTNVLSTFTPRSTI